MDYLFFNHTLDMANPPERFTTELQALWWERKNHWDKAHEMVQDMPGEDAAWVHAYLHRKEGDSGNASYWYSRSGRPFPEKDLNDEFRDLVKTLLEEIS